MNGKTLLATLAAVLLFALVACISAQAEECYMVDVERIVDGDTVVIAGERVRLMDYDAPELRGAKCEAERKLAQQATERLWRLLGAPDVLACFYGRGKYGRPLARLWSGGYEVAEVMVTSGLGRPYQGGKRESWCE